MVRVLRKKLGSGNLRVLSVSLTLAETLVKNCGDPVHREVASERFMAAMAKIARVSRREKGRNYCCSFCNYSSGDYLDINPFTTAVPMFGQNTWGHCRLGNIQEFEGNGLTRALHGSGRVMVTRPDPRDF